MRDRTASPGRRRIVAPAVLAVLLFVAGSAGGGIVPPRGGGPLPDAYRRLREKNRSAFTVSHGWVARARRARSSNADVSAMALDRVIPVAGSLRVPVLSARYADTDEVVSTAALRRVLFEGPMRYGTVADYYDEVSRKRFGVAGEVSGWYDLDNAESFYVGLFNGLDPVYSRTGELIRETVSAADPGIDFGRFDNDGPDGVPNSGDDDGFVDVLIIVHSTRGGECGGTSLWSHSWGYSNWNASGGEPYPTDDAAFGGGTILIEDYIVAPSRSCDGETIEIAVFCHELGHTLGLPDLYDFNGGGYGIGHWGLMGSGNWNSPDSPAHLCGWSKNQLGWVETIDVGADPLSLDLAPVEEGGAILRLDLPGERFGRARDPENLADHALACFYDETAAGIRNWPGGAGYGNGWHESVYRDFTHAGGGAAVSVSYVYEVDLEEGYDFARLLLEQPGGTDTLRVYTGETVFANDSVDLGLLLSPFGGVFRLRFEVTSDYNFSDEDGRYDSGPGAPFLVDDIVVSGLPEGTVVCGFDEHDCGWRGGGEPAEYFVVEHRRRIGFDRHLHGEGLVVWHAENSTAFTALGNSGGFSNVQARGVVLQEADGRYDLLAGANSGDAGDPFPGRAGNILFDASTLPSSRDNGGRATPVRIDRISEGGRNIEARFVAGAWPPEIAAVRPDSIFGEGGDVRLDVRGRHFQPGAACFLRRQGIETAAAVEWLGGEALLVDLATGPLTAGAYDIIVRNPDGQTTSANGAVVVLSRFTVAGVKIGRSFVRIDWGVSPAGLIGCLLRRGAEDGGWTLLTPDTLRDESGVFSFTDRTAAPGEAYAYGIEAFFSGGERGALALPGPWTVPPLPFLVEPPRPNPFNGAVTTSFFVPERRRVSIDVIDVAGRLVAPLGERFYDRGTHEVSWEPSPGEAAPGVYFLVFRAGDLSRTVKLVLVR
ncbi:MAG: M6 family metalloprotease domain-containing protein [Candidatus Krumholzibacteriota bacterium]|nr:M6 family metalloprotease domain-containing protein [Candidatus Krumholzibacteriota bacterium]